MILSGERIFLKKSESQALSLKQNNLPPVNNKIYYGGSIGFNFWNDYFYISASPWIGYKFSPKFSVWAKILYSYLSDDRYDPYPTLKTHNFGSSIFIRYKISQNLYAHSAFVYSSYERIKSFNINQQTYETERNWISFLLVGAGYMQSIRKNICTYGKILFDVL